MRLRWIGLGGAALLAAGLAAWPRGDRTEAQPSERPVPTVATAIAVTRDLPVFVRGTGRVEPFNMVQVKSRVDGPIEQVLFTEGETVTAGQPLFEIDPRPYQAALAQAEGQLARDQAQLIAAKADLDRAASLLQKGFASHQTVDQQSAQAGQFAAAVKSDQALVDNARLNLSFTTIRAPIAGRIGKRLIDAGNLLHAADGASLVEIAQIRPISIVLTVPQEALPGIQMHQRDGHLSVEVRAPDDVALLALGDLVLIGNMIDQGTGTIALKASAPNLDERLWPGQLVNTRVITHLRHNAVAVPPAAVQPGPDGKFVYVVDANAAVALRPVTLGEPAPGVAVIESGLAPGETVVIDNQDLLKPGMIIKPSAAAVSSGSGPVASPS